MTTRIPPQFLPGERAILGGLLLDDEAVARVLPVLEPDDFYREAHRVTYAAIRDLFDRSEPVDYVSLTNALSQAGKLEQVGGVAFLTDLADAVPSAANVMHYAGVVRNKSLLRKVINAANEVIAEAYDDPEDVSGFLDDAEQAIFKVGESRIKAGATSARELMRSGLETVEVLYERKELITGVPSGFKDLDKLTAGFQPTDLIIIAGRPSMGKTAFAMNVALHAAMALKVPTLVDSLEMGKDQLGLRMLCSAAKVNLRSLRTGWLTPTDWSRLTIAAGGIAEAPLWIDDAAAQSTLEVRAKARRMHREHKLGLIVVDYLQLMRAPKSRGGTREEEISEISRSLKALAKELHVPVIALSQLNRKVEERPNKRPQLADLRESGAIEQDADVILFIYRDEVYNKSPDNPEKGIAEIIIGKQRNGPIGMVKAAFRSEWSTFLPLEWRDEEQQEAMQEGL